jgi:hypothetical protein
MIRSLPALISTMFWMTSSPLGRNDLFLPCRKYTTWKQLHNQSFAFVWICIPTGLATALQIKR